MPEGKRYITIHFKDGHEARYMAVQSEADRLANEFHAATRGTQGDPRNSIYDVFDYDDQPRKLVLVFADVLYIG